MLSMRVSYLQQCWFIALAFLPTNTMNKIRLESYYILDDEESQDRLEQILYIGILDCMEFR